MREDDIGGKPRKSRWAYSKATRNWTREPHSDGERRLWLRAEQEITQKYIEGLGVPEIAAETGYTEKQIRFVITNANLKKQAETHRKEITQAVLEDKVPLLKKITQLSLTTLASYLEDLSTDEEKKSNLTTKDGLDLANITHKINEVLRLELGQSTQNVAVQAQVTHDQAQGILEHLRLKDPVFGEFYPELKQLETHDTTALPEPACGIAVESDVRPVPVDRAAEGDDSP